MTLNNFIPSADFKLNAGAASNASSLNSRRGENLKIKLLKSKNINSKDNKVQTEEDDEFDEYEQDRDPFKQTGRLFGCLLRDFKCRYSMYASDFSDALNWRCFIALFFTFTVCLAPALSFGGILADKTNKWFGTK